MRLENPFTVHSPEGMAADTIVALFVDVFTDFYNVPHQGHTFLHGPRGSGKSMMFRYLEPDCQALALQKPIAELPFFSIYFPIRTTDMRLAELLRLRKTHAEHVLNEHLLSLHSAMRLIDSLRRFLPSSQLSLVGSEITVLYKTKIRQLMDQAGWDSHRPQVEDDASDGECLNTIYAELNQALSDLTRYLRSLTFVPSAVPYTGPLCGYLDFVLPLAQMVRTLACMPKGPLYLLVDDADNLSVSQTRVLNSWVACRTSSDVSLKISTQLRYKTYLTTNRQPVRSPHDYSEVNIADVYTSNRSQYAQRVEAIVTRRLLAAGISQLASEFFPVYEKQEAAISRVAERLLIDWETSGRGFRARDDAARYARPMFIRGLSGDKKAGSKYKYAGLRQLIAISSGIVRYFLDAAAIMYADTKAKVGAEVIVKISPDVQDTVVRRQAEEFLFRQSEPAPNRFKSSVESLSRQQKLNNLVRGLGGAFFQILISEASERRVFSIALSDEPSPEVADILNLGVELGFFHESMIGNKEGTGRTRLYILSRRLAPFFKLDPTSFAGYKFVTSEKLTEAIYTPKRFVSRLKATAQRRGYISEPQLEMFQDEGGVEVSDEND